MKTFKIISNKRTEIIEITQIIRDHIAEEKYDSGIILVYSPHTTACITINENADSSVRKDITGYLNKVVPKDFGFSHMEGNSDAHIKGSLINFSQTFIVKDSELKLGTWQGIYFCEFDGPRDREFWVKFIPG